MPLESCCSHKGLAIHFGSRDWSKGIDRSDVQKLTYTLSEFEAYPEGGGEACLFMACFIT
jgi:hypothetical protein